MLLMYNFLYGGGVNILGNKAKYIIQFSSLFIFITSNLHQLSDRHLVAIYRFSIEWRVEYHWNDIQIRLGITGQFFVANPM